MPFLIFICSIFALAYYQRLEHRQLIVSLRALQKQLACETPGRTLIEQQLETEDWRVIDLENTRLSLRRKFMVQDRQALIRYAIPVIILCVILVLLQNFILAALCIAGLAIKWFVSVTVLELSPHHPEFEVTVFGQRIFMQNLAPPQEQNSKAEV
ncbi:MAG: hypothetical protein PW788_02610 [Micavibrio sp.]|nr:hypothetical protein [Micavibrio sp.]